MKNKPVHTIKQNVLFPFGVIFFIVAFVFGLFYLADFYGHTSRIWKNMIIVIATIGLVFQIIIRFYSWQLVLYDDKLVLEKPFGIMPNSRKEFNYSEIKEIGFMQGFRQNTTLRIDMKSGKKYNVFLDQKLTEISKFLTFLENSEVIVGLYCDNRIKKKLKRLGVKTA